MAKTRVAMELGMGTCLRAEDYTKAAMRALKDALWHNSLTMADAFGFPRNAMIVDIEIAVQNRKRSTRTQSRLSCLMVRGQLPL